MGTFVSRPIYQGRRSQVVAVRGPRCSLSPESTILILGKLHVGALHCLLQHRLALSRLSLFMHCVHIHSIRLSSNRWGTRGRAAHLNTVVGNLPAGSYL